MFPPKVIGIIGNEGKMAKPTERFLASQGLEFIGSDRKNPQGLNNKDVVKRADLVFFSITPIARTATIIENLIPFARPNTLWLHGTSVQEPVHGPISEVFYDGRLRAKGVDTGYLHFMVGPSIQSLRGQTVLLHLSPPEIEKRWKDWLLTQLAEKQGAFIEMISPAGHDVLTIGAQLVHLIQGLLSLSIWHDQDLNLEKTIEIAGPPGWLLAYSAIRSSGQPDMTAEILNNHYATSEIIDTAIRVLRTVQTAVINNQPEIISGLVGSMSSSIPPVLREISAERTDFHIRVEGDLRGQALRIDFTAELNQTGLLAKVLGFFDAEGLGKTSCEAQELPDETCVFYVGLKVPLDDQRVSKACQAIEAIGGNIRRISRLSN